MVSNATPTASVPSVDWRMHPRQSEAWLLAHDPAVIELLYGGAKGGGKSIWLCRIVWAMAIELIRKYGLEPSRYPLPVGWIGRKHSIDFKKTTFNTWKQWIDPRLYRLHKSEQQIIIAETVAIDYGGLDSEGAVNKFNSAEYAFIAVDQAEETTRDDVGVLRGSRRLQLGQPPRPVPVKGLYTANPAAGSWLHEDFILSPPTDGSMRFVQALPSDNPFLHPDYQQTIISAFRHRPALLAAYLHGRWDAFEADDQVIVSAWIDAAGSRLLQRPIRHRLLACDVARFGDDETVIYQMDESRIVDERVYGKKDTMYTANVLHVMAAKNNIGTIVVDVGGPGAGVVDRLVEMSNGQYDVLAFNSSASPSSDLYLNLRAEAWDAAAKMFAEGDVDFASDIEPVLRGQLCTPKFKYRNGLMRVEEKDEIKKRLKRSPDRADAYVYGLYALYTHQVREPAKDTQRVENWRTSHFASAGRSYRAM